MKIRSILAILTAAAVLTGCSSGKTTLTESDPYATEPGAPVVSGTSPAASAAEPDVPSDPETSSVVSPETPATGTSTAASPAPVTASTGAATEPVSTSAATTAADTAPSTTKPAETAPSETKPAETHTEPKKSEYTARDIGGTGAAPGEFFDDGFCDEAEAAVDGGFDYAYSEIAAAGAAECPGYPVEPVPGWDIQPEAGLLTGGEWNDNENWEFWQGLFDSNNYGVDWSGYKETWRTGADFRLEVTVKDSAGKPVSGARVTSDEPEYSSVTDNEGKAYLFYSFGQVINGFTQITATYGDSSGSERLTLGADESLEITLDSEVKPAEKTLDLMIMCDTTGSMSDELEYLKEELEDVVKRIRSDNSNIKVRLSVNFYRDEGDEYVVREFPFTDDLDAVVGAISQQWASGGGDTPEAVHTALDSAVNSHDWDEDSVKVMFLVLDAPPHSDTQIIDEVVKHVRTAAQKGIRIVPVAASGVDKSCEFLLRSMAFMTGGTYAFLTDDSGIGYGHTEPTVGSYEVEKLNDMMVRICNKYLG